MGVNNTPINFVVRFLVNKTAIFGISILLMLAIIYSYFLWQRYHIPNNGSLNKYLVLTDCGFSGLNIIDKFKYAGPISSTIACALREINKDDMGTGIFYIDEEAGPEPPSNTRFFILWGDIACIQLREKQQELEFYLYDNLNVLNWLVETYDHGAHTDNAKKLIETTKNNSASIPEICAAYRSVI